MRIYVVSIGEYSYCHNVAVFSARNKAEAFSILVGGNAVEEYELDTPPQTPTPPAGADALYVIEMKRNGDVVNCFGLPLLEVVSNDRFEIRKQGWAVAKNERRGKWRLRVDVYAKNKEHAIKIAGDLRAEIITGRRGENGIL